MNYVKSMTREQLVRVIKAGNRVWDGYFTAQIENQFDTNNQNCHVAEFYLRQQNDVKRRLFKYNSELQHRNWKAQYAEATA